MEGLENAAIHAALCGNWAQAVDLNLKILQKNKKDIATINRLTRAYIELGRKGLAFKTLKSALKIDPYNQIAQKLKLRLSSKAPISPNSPKPHTSSPVFIEEPGITQTVSLINLAPQKTLALMECAREVYLIPKHHSVHVHFDDRYIGSLPDDLGKRLHLLINYGNTYQSFVKSVGPQTVTIFIREISRGKKYLNLASFIPRTENFRRIIEESPPDRQIEPDDEESQTPKSVVIHQDEEPEEGP